MSSISRRSEPPGISRQDFRSRRPTPDDGGWRLSPFDILYAPSIASWVRSARELTWLAPATPPPLSTAKVVGWKRNGGERLLLWTDATDAPIAYAELNEMPSRPRHLWIGHLLVDPAFRGRGIGQRFVQALLVRAFTELNAREVLLVVVPENRPAIRCYQASGMIVTGQERKTFERVRREFVFIRMAINRRRFNRFVAAGRLPNRPVALVEDCAALRRRRAPRTRATAQRPEPQLRVRA